MDPNVVSMRPDGGARRHPLLFVHGAWHGAWCWERLMPWFARRGWECHALDLRGHGDTPNDRSLRLTRIKHYVEDLGAAVDSLQEDPILVGHSMGGLVAQRYLEGRHLPGCVLLAPVPIGGVTRTTFRVAIRHPVAFLKANLTWNLGAIMHSDRVAHDLLFPDSMPSVDAQPHLDRLQDESYLAYLDMLLFTRARPQLVDTRVSVITGSEDRIFTPGQLRRNAQAYGTELQVIEGAAHDLMLGPKWERVAEAIAGRLEP